MAQAEAVFSGLVEFCAKTLEGELPPDWNAPGSKRENSLITRSKNASMAASPARRTASLRCEVISNSIVPIPMAGR